LEAKEREEERGEKPGRWEPEDGARWLALFVTGEKALFVGGGGDPEGVECDDKRSSHMSPSSRRSRSPPWAELVYSSFHDALTPDATGVCSAGRYMRRRDAMLAPQRTRREASECEWWRGSRKGVM
jgi:hypothetical protein